jgi:hydroxyacylglutathione hydrolase
MTSRAATADPVERRERGADVSARYLVTPLRVARSAFVNYCYILTNPQTRDSVVVDPAWELDTIDRALAARGSALRGVLLTHSHHDHVHLAETLARREGCPVFMSEEEAGFYGFRCTNLELIRSERALRVGSIDVVPIATPGHTKGGLSYLTGDAVFTGDTLFAEGCGICAGHGADPSVLFDTLQKLKSRLAPGVRVFPGHSYGLPPGQTFSSLSAVNIYLMFHEREHFVSFRMRKDQKRLFEFK